MGDAVFELHVRRQLMAKPAPLDTLHAAKVRRVKAEAQAAALRALMPHLTEAELDIVRRARNAKSNVPRHVAVTDYRHSTAFEALLGLLYLRGDQARLEELLALVDREHEETLHG